MQAESRSGCKTGAVRIALRVFAALGVVFVLLLLIAVVAWFSWTTPLEESATAPSGESAPTPTAPDGQPLGENDLRAGDAVLQAPQVDTSAGPISDVRIDASDFLKQGDAVTASGVAAQATVPFDTVEAQVGGGMELRALEDGRVAARLPIEVLGRGVTVVGNGHVQGNGNTIAFQPSEVGIEGGPSGIGVPGPVADRLTFGEAVPGLPEGLSITRIDVVDGGFQVYLTGDQVSLSTN